MGIITRLKRIFSSSTPLSEWFKVSFDEATVTLDVRPPAGQAWQDQFYWKDVNRVCFKAEPLEQSDGIYVFTSRRPESYVIPTEAKGGLELWNEILRRGLFDPELAIRALSAPEGLFCWPP